MRVLLACASRQHEVRCGFSACFAAFRCFRASSGDASVCRALGVNLSLSSATFRGKRHAQVVFKTWVDTGRGQGRGRDGRRQRWRREREGERGRERERERERERQRQKQTKKQTQTFAFVWGPNPEIPQRREKCYSRMPIDDKSLSEIGPSKFQQ